MSMLRLIAIFAAVLGIGGVAISGEPLRQDDINRLKDSIANGATVFELQEKAFVFRDKSVCSGFLALLKNSKSSGKQILELIEAGEVIQVKAGVKVVILEKQDLPLVKVRVLGSDAQGWALAFQLVPPR